MRSRRIIFTVLALGIFACSAMAAESDAIPRAAKESPSVSASAAETSHVGYDTTRVGMALIAVIGLILAIKWGSGKFLGASSVHRSSRAVHVLCRNTIGPRQNLVLVQVGRRLVLVGDSGTQLTTLGEITDADEIAEVVGQVGREKSEPLSKTFGNLFKKAEGGFDNEPAQHENHIFGSEREEMGSDREERGAPAPELDGLTSRIRSLSRQFGKAT